MMGSKQVSEWEHVCDLCTARTVNVTATPPVGWHHVSWNPEEHSYRRSDFDDLYETRLLCDGCMAKLKAHKP